MTVVDIRRVSTTLSFTCLGNLLAHKCKHEPVCTRVVVVLVLVEEVQGVDGSRSQGLAPPDVPSRLCQILRDGSGVQLTSYSATPVQCRRAVLQALRHSGNSLKKYWKIQKKIWTRTGSSGLVCEDISGCKRLWNWVFVAIDFFCTDKSCVFRLYSLVFAEN